MKKTKKQLGKALLALLLAMALAVLLLPATAQAVDTRPQGTALAEPEDPTPSDEDTTAPVSGGDEAPEDEDGTAPGADSDAPEGAPSGQEQPDTERDITPASGSDGPWTDPSFTPTPEQVALQAAIDNAAAKAQGGTVTVTSNMQVGALFIPAGGPVTLKGGAGGPWVISRHFTSNAMVVVNSGASLTLQDLVLDGGSSNTSYCIVRNEGTLTIKAGTVLRNNVGESAVRNRSSFTMAGGTISGNSAYYGGGVYTDGGTFKMTAGNITGNTVSTDGGGVYACDGATVTITGGTIAGNSARWGGGVYVQDSILNLYGGSITGNEADNDGGGAFLSGMGWSEEPGSIDGPAAADTQYGNHVITGGSITGNNASSGGGVYISSCTLKLSGGTISGNSAYYGGGLYLSSSSKVTMTSGSITGNIAETDGGGVNNPDGEFTVTGGSITGNRAEKNGGGLYTRFNWYGGAVLAGGSITGNSAGNFGAEMYLGSNVKLQGKPVVGSKNTTGGVWLNDDGTIVIGETPLATGAYVKFEGATNYAEGSTAAVTNYNGKNAVHKAAFAVGSDTLRLEPNADGNTLMLVNRPLDSQNSSRLQELINASKGTAAKPAVITLPRTERPDETLTIGAGKHVLLTGGTLLRSDTRSDTPLVEIAPGASLTLENITLDGDIRPASVPMIQVNGTDNKTYGKLIIKNGAVLRNAANHVSEDSGPRGGAIWVARYAQLQMSGGSIAKNSAFGYGGGIFNEGTVTITGGSITGNTSYAAGGGIYSTGEGSVVTLKGGQITSNVSSNTGGGIHISNGTSLTISGGTIARNTAASSHGGGVYFDGGADRFTISGGSIANNRCGGNGGGVYSLEPFTLQGGAISGNTAQTNGGGVYITGGESDTIFFTMAGGSITGNLAQNDGGGVYTDNKAALNATAGSIAGNHADANGGGLYCYDNSNLLNGTALAGNTAAGQGAEAYVSHGKALGLKGKAQIGLAGEAGGVYLKGTNGLALQGNLAKGSLVVIEGADVLTGDSSVLLASKDTAITAAEQKMFHLMAAEWSLEPGSDGKTLQAVRTTLQSKINSEEAASATKQKPYVIVVEGTTTLANTLQISGSRHILLSGSGTLNRANEHDQAMIGVAAGGSLVLDGPTLDGTLPGETTAQGAVVYNEGSLELRSGTITGNNMGIFTEGGGVRNNGANATFLMTGGAIAGNQAPGGGGIYNRDGEITIAGGSITGNAATGASAGGGVYSDSGSLLVTGGTIAENTAHSGAGIASYTEDVTISGGMLRNNTAGQWGGGVMLAGGTATLEGGTISGNKALDGAGIHASGTDIRLSLQGGQVRGNTASFNGGGVYLSGEGTFVLKDSTISGNTAQRGGGLYAENAAVTMAGGSLTGNAAIHGGGAYSRLCSFMLNGGTIENNTAAIPDGVSYMGGAPAGGGISIYEGTVTQSGGTIAGNTADMGGGVNLGGSGTFTQNGGTIAGNTAETGGGVNLGSGTFTQNGGTIAGNTATASGGGVYASDFNRITLAGGSIAGNTAAEGGGGVYVENDGTFIVTGGSIRANKANYGGGIYSAVEFTLRGAAVSDNRAQDGGGLYATKKVVLDGTLTGNTATGDGGGVYSSGAHTTLAGATITGNTAGKLAGGLYVADEALVLEAGTVMANTAKGGGQDVVGKQQVSLSTTGPLRLGTPGKGGLGADSYGLEVTQAIFPGTLVVVEFGSDKPIVSSDSYTLQESDLKYFEPPAGKSLRFNTSDSKIQVADTAPAPVLTVYFDTTIAGGLYRAVPASWPWEITAAEVPTPVAPNRSHQFSHWNTKADGTGTTYRYGDALPQITGDLTLYAIWNVLDYTITYYSSYTDDENNTVFQPGTANNPASYRAGDDISLNAPGVYQQDMEFAGWTLVGDASQIVVERISPAWRGDKALVAQWKAATISTDALQAADGTQQTATALPGPGSVTSGAGLLKAGTDLGETTPHNSVYWYSSNEIVATVDQQGYITSQRPGTAQVVVTRRHKPGEADYTVTIDVTVMVDEPLRFLAGNADSPAVENIVLQQGTDPAGTWQTGTEAVSLMEHLYLYNSDLNTFVRLDNSSGYDAGLLSWKSRKPTLVAVDSSGVATPKNPGETVIEVLYGGHSATLKVTVMKAGTALTGATVSKSTLALDVGQSAALKGSALPAGAKLAESRWSVVPQSAGSAAVTVDQLGKVTAVYPGTAQVVFGATDVFGNYQEQACVVTVTQPATGVTLRAAGAQNGELVLVRSGLEAFPSAQPTATVLPATAGDRRVTYSPALANNTETKATTVAYYNEDTGAITAGPKDGSVTITAATANGKKASLTVRVVTPAAGVNMTASSFVLETGKTKKLTAALAEPSINGADRKVTDTKLVWISSDTSVATVNGGTVKAVGDGTATITAQATSSYYDTSALAKSVQVTVHTTVKSLKMNQKAFSLLGGDIIQLSASANGGQAMSQGLLWSASKNAGVLSVNPRTGLVRSYAVKKNTTVTVTATAQNGKKASVKITVTPNPPLLLEKLALKKAAPQTLIKGKSFTPGVTVIPSKAANKNLTWQATVDQALDLEGAPVVGDTPLARAVWLDPATGKLTWRLSDEWSEATVTVTGTALYSDKQTDDGTPPDVTYTLRVAHGATKVTLVNASGAAQPKAAMTQGASLQLTALAGSPSNVPMAWKSSNPKVLRVEPGADGSSVYLVALKGGSATVTATAGDGSGKKATCKVTVTQQLRSVVLRGMDTEAAPGAIGAGGSYGVLEVKAGKARTLVPVRNTGYDQPKSKTLVYQVLEEYDASGRAAQAGSILSLNAKTGSAKGLKPGSALVRVYSPECPANDFALTVPASGKLAEEYCRNICVIEVSD